MSVLILSMLLALMGLLAFADQSIREWRSGMPRTVILEQILLIRYPLLVGMLLVVFPPVALYLDPVRQMLSNLFVVQSAWHLGLASMLAFLATWCVWGPGRVIQDQSEPRFHIPPFREGPLRSVFSGGGLIVVSLLALPTVAGLAAESAPEIGGWSVALGTLGGLVGTLMVLWAALLVRALIMEPREFRYVDWFETKFIPKSVVAAHWASQMAPVRMTRKALLFIFGKLGPGFTTMEDGVKKFASGQVEVLAHLVVTVLLYGLGFWIFDPFGNRSLPAIGYLIVLLILLGWLLPGLAFILDRRRFPTSLFLGGLLLLLSIATDNDHVYRVVPDTASDSLPPAHTVPTWKAHPGPGGRPLLVAVAASGGGITAAYWTTLVFSELERRFGPDFLRSVRVISSVSGGSVGTMFFVERYTLEHPPTPRDLAVGVERDSLDGAILKAASNSSLAEAAWGLVYPDFLRLLPLPISNERDRGWATEIAWGKQQLDSTAVFSDWRNGVRAGWMPAVIFNATAVETGERFLMSSLDLPYRTFDGREFRDLYRGWDVPVRTAARLSATFPYVTPISRPNLDRSVPNLFHLADGGYYDNYGVLSLIEWLRSIAGPYHDLWDLDEGPPKVLIIQIEASTYERQERIRERGRLGWLYASVGPIQALANVRNSAQRTRNRIELDLLQGELCQKGLDVLPAIFALRAEGPLSWQLSKSERQAIRDGLTDDSIVAAAGRVERFLAAEGRGCGMDTVEGVATPEVEP